jgi:hypothetical protein
LTFIRASESNSVGSIENGHVEKGQTLGRPIPQEANPFPGIHRGKVPHPLFMDDRLTREVMDIYEGFVSNPPLIGDKKHSNPIINAKEANHLTETVTGSHLSGVVPQNSRNPIKRKDGGGSLHVLEDVRKIQSKIVPPNSRQIENHRSIAKKQRKAENVENIQPIDEKKMKDVLEIRKPSKKDWESALKFFEKENSPLDDEVMKSVIDEFIEQSPLEYDWKNWDFATPHPIINSADGSVRKLSQDSSIPIKKAILSKLPRFFKI